MIRNSLANFLRKIADKISSTPSTATDDLLRRLNAGGEARELGKGEVVSSSLPLSGSRGVADSHGTLRSTKMGEQVNEDEMVALREGKCPDCTVGTLLEGPWGGLSVNVKCSVCGSKFNLMPGFGADRISEPSPDLGAKA